MLCHNRVLETLFSYRPFLTALEHWNRFSVFVFAVSKHVALSSVHVGKTLGLVGSKREVPRAFTAHLLRVRGCAEGFTSHGSLWPLWHEWASLRFAHSEMRSRGMCPKPAADNVRRPVLLSVSHAALLSASQVSNELTLGSPRSFTWPVARKSLLCSL